MPDKYTIGNAPRAFFDVLGPAYKNVGLSLEKSTTVAGDANFQIRLEWINVLDTTKWAGPRARFGRSTFGQIQSTLSFPRTLQILARLRW